MSAIKESNGTWSARFYVNTLEGKIRKRKRGFNTKREALEWEREFLAKTHLDVNMSFGSLYELYKEDMEIRLREHTNKTKVYIIETKILPFFQKMKISDITPLVVRKWQSSLIKSKNPRNNTPYSQTYIKSINNQLTAIFNYAIKFHNLTENPCHKAGSIGKKNAGEMDIWTPDEFYSFVALVQHKPKSYTGFNILFWTGIRIGELLALTVEDFNFEKKVLRINKSYQRLNGKDIITEPKTPKSIRTLDISDSLIILVKDYISKLYKPNGNTRLFDGTKHLFEHDMRFYSLRANLKKIRLHDLRHSHASYLINNNVNILAIANRLGHEKIETTLNIYSHLYRESQDHMISILNKN